MKMVFLSLIAFCLIVTSIDAQQKKISRRRDDVRLMKDKPSVYISFERFGEREPLEPGESREGIWLRFHNNTKWPIFFRAFSVPKELGEAGMYYEIRELPQASVERGSPSSSKTKEDIKQKTDLSTGYQPVDSFSVISIESGDSILFSIPSEHLAEGLYLRMGFNYGWEDQNDVTAGREAFHYVSFSSSALPPRQKK
jgi:hypothetical protein